MFNYYDELNNDAKDYLMIELDESIKDDVIKDRCRKEIDILFDRNLLFIVEYLYRYKIFNKNVRFCFKGTTNNLLLLYVLGLSNVDPLKYNLPYELFNEKKLSIEFVNDSYISFIDFLEQFYGLFRVAKGNYEKEELEEANKACDNHYLIMPFCEPEMTFKFNEFNQLETVDDYRLYKDKYITIKLDDKFNILSDKVNIKYSLKNEYEEELAKKLNAKSVEDYAKVISLAHSTHVWKTNQDVLFEDGVIDIQSLIASREDIYEYLINHNIDSQTSIDIIKHIISNRNNGNNKLWEKYVKVMKEKECDDIFINIISKILFISGRGQALGECLYSLDEHNYYSYENEK